MSTDITLTGVPRLQGKQAKMVSLTQERTMLGSLATTHSPTRDHVLFLLSMKAGLRAKAMALLTWAMVTDAAGHVAEVLHVPNRASKEKTGGRTIPCTPICRRRLSRCRPHAGTWRPPSGRSHIPSDLVVDSCHHMLRAAQPLISR